MGRVVDRGRRGAAVGHVMPSAHCSGDIVIIVIAIPDLPDDGIHVIAYTCMMNSYSNRSYY